MKKRLLQRISVYGGIFTVGALYFFVVKYAHVGLSCPIRHITGLKCPGCGVSRMAIAVLNGNFCKMFSYNLVLPFVLPVIAVMLLVGEAAYVKNGVFVPGKGYKTAGVAVIAVLLVYGILRNILNI